MLLRKDVGMNSYTLCFFVVGTGIAFLLSIPLNLLALEGTAWTVAGSLKVRDKNRGRAQTTAIMHVFFGSQTVALESRGIDLSTNDFLVILEGSQGTLTGTYQANKKGTKARLFPTTGGNEFATELLELALAAMVSEPISLKNLKLTAKIKSQGGKIKLKGKTTSKVKFSYLGMKTSHPIAPMIPDSAAETESSPLSEAERIGCSGEVYPEQMISQYILPYEVGQTFEVSAGNWW